MQVKRQRQGSENIVDGFHCFRDAEAAAVISTPVDFESDFSYRQNPYYSQVALPSQRHIQFDANYLQLLNSTPVHSVVSNLEDNGNETGILYSRSTEEQETTTSPFIQLNQARFGAQNRPVVFPADQEELMNEEPEQNGLNSSESDNQPIMDCRGEKKQNKGKTQVVPRFRPSDEQKQILEQHFQSGLTKPTPGLITAVQKAGKATERQITVWLKNRLSRYKRSVAQQSRKTETNEPQQVRRRSGMMAPEQVHHHSASRMSLGLQSREDFSTIVLSVIDELDLILKNVDTNGISSLCGALFAAPKIVCYGVGKEGCIMNKFASNLNSLGFQATSINDIGTLPVYQNDLFLVSAGPSCYGSVSSLALEAVRMGANVVAFTAHKTADTLFTESFIRIPAQTLIPCFADHHHHELSLSSPGILTINSTVSFNLHF
eukprot:g474.t1